MIELHLNISPEMRDCKTQFWKALESNPICDPDHVTLAAVLQLTGNKKVTGWWDKPRFAEWFCAGDEFEIKLSSAKFSALEALLEIASNPDSPASARVAAAKQILDHARVMDKENPAMEKLLDKIAGVNNVEDLKKYPHHNKFVLTNRRDVS